MQLRSVLCLGGQSCLLAEEPIAQRPCNTHRCTTAAPHVHATPASTRTSETTTPYPSTTEQHSPSTVLSTSKESNFTTTTEQPSAATHNQTTDHYEYYYYYYYDDEDGKKEESESRDKKHQFKWIPLTWGEVSILTFITERNFLAQILSWSCETAHSNV